MKKRLVSIALITFMMLSMLSTFTFAATVYGGACGKNGDNMTWSYDNVAKELIITGSGEMKDYSYTDGTYAPWRQYKDNIVRITLSSGITKIGEYAFFEFSKLTAISIPDSVTYIGKDAFKLCTSLTVFTAPKGITEITRHLFHDCYALTKVILHKNITTIHANAFENCDNLAHIEYEGSDKDFEKITFDKREGKELLEFNPNVLIKFKGGHTHTLTDYISNGKGTCFVEATESANCEFKYCNYKETRVDEDAPSPHWFAYYIYDNNESYGKNGTETAICQLGCQKTNTREKPGTMLVDSAKMFKDVQSGKWYTQYIDSAVGRELFKGITDNTFEPNTPMDRGMFVTVLCRMSGVTVSTDTATGFKDAPAGKYYSGAVKWAYDAGIVKGITETTFEPNTAITREQLCTMLVRYSDYMGIVIDSTADSITFTDDGKIGTYAYNSVYICQRGGLINGVGDGSFAPKKTATRAEVAKILALYVKYNLSVTYVPPTE